MNDVALAIYDWLLCVDQEFRFIWNWHSKVTASTLVYVLSRYVMLTSFILAFATIFPMLDIVSYLSTTLNALNGLIIVFLEVTVHHQPLIRL